MKNYPTEEMLSAYVDGELSPEDDARVADAIARSPQLAAHVASLSRVKSELAGLAMEPAAPIEFPRRRWSKAMTVVAASIGLLLAAISGILTGYLHFGENNRDWYEMAAATHSNWLLQPASTEAGEVDANIYLANVNRLQLPVYAPDLGDARLRLTYMKFMESNASSPAALHLGYTGRRGCRLTLWVTSAPKGMSTKLVEARNKSLRGFRWRAGKVAYALFSTGMAEQRFTTIADKVYEATSESHGFDAEMRMALNEVSRRAPPCSA